MSNEAATARREGKSRDGVPADAAPERAESSSPAPVVIFMDDEEVRRAAEKVFRLHARLFEELAK